LPDYRVFGRNVRSQLTFPELVSERIPEGELDLTLERIAAPPPDPGDGAVLLGTTTIAQDVQVQLHTLGSDLILTFEDTGTFRISSRRIMWWPGEDFPEEAARVDVKGRVIPLALHLSGLLSLHAGAVLHEGSVIGFLGPKRSGKSTLTAAMLDEGCEFVTDDVLALVPKPGDLRVRPGFPALRLWKDSADAIAPETDYREEGLAGKLNVRTVPARIPGKGAPLGALYVLTPELREQEYPEPVRRRLSESEALLVMLANVKNGELLGGAEHLTVLDRAAIVARSVPCYQLSLPRKLEALPVVARRILEWHGGGSENP